MRGSPSAKYFERVLTLVPERVDAEHSAVVYFCVLALRVLARRAQSGRAGGDPRAHGALASLAPALQNYVRDMFTGTGFRAAKLGPEEPHVLSTYFCLAVAHMTGCVLSSAERAQVARFVACCRMPGGLYCVSARECEFACSALPSLRATYAALASLALLQLPVDDPECVAQIKQRQNYDGGFGERECDESHAGLTYCALAALHLAGGLDARTRARAARFLLRRCSTESGLAFAGRAGKEPDSCYTFWVVAGLRLLGVSVDAELDSSEFLASCFDPILKAYAPVPGAEPDAYHTALVLAALNISDVDPVLAVVHDR